MEKTDQKHIENSKSEFNIQDLFRSKFFVFAMLFAALIFLSNKYAQKPSPSVSKATGVGFPGGKSAQNEVSLKNQAIAYSNEESSDETIDELAVFAISLLGKKYTPAGKSPSVGFDCSGFTQYVFKEFDIQIPPSSITQSRVGERIRLEDARKGDLIFFKSPSIGVNEIGHVGIVISNDNNKISFVHSSTSRGVVIDNLDSKHYKSRYRTIRRININNDSQIASNQL